MEYWFETEIRARREGVVASVKRRKQIRLAKRGRSSARAYVAGGIQAVSDCLAVIATRLRGIEHA